jgi:rRNA maturation endonuclease Nob1
MRMRMRMKMNMMKNVNMKMNINMKMKKSLDVLMYSMMGRCDDCGAPMSNDCQACGTIQAHAKLSISLEYMRKN